MVFNLYRNKENVKFKHKMICYNCNEWIESGMYHIVNRYLTYYFCNRDCYSQYYGDSVKEEFN